MFEYICPFCKKEIAFERKTFCITHIKVTCLHCKTEYTIRIENSLVTKIALLIVYGLVAKILGFSGYFNFICEFLIFADLPSQVLLKKKKKIVLQNFKVSIRK